MEENNITAASLECKLPHISSFSLLPFDSDYLRLLRRPNIYKVWNRKSLKDMPFLVKIHQHYPRGINSPSIILRRRRSEGMQGSDGSVSLIPPFVFPSEHLHPHTHTHLEMMTKHRRHAFHTVSLTEVRALHDPELTVAAEGAHGHVRGRHLPVGRAFCPVPHHRHNPVALHTVHTVHGKIPEAVLLEGQG